MRGPGVYAKHNDCILYNAKKKMKQYKKKIKLACTTKFGEKKRY